MSSGYSILPPDPVAVFKALALEVGDVNQLSVKFIDGTWQYIVNQLDAQKKAKASKNDMYPLVALIHSFPQKMVGNSPWYSMKLDFALLMISDPNWTVDDRRSNNYTTYLNPLYAEFMARIDESPMISGEKMVHYPHEKIDDYHMGAESKDAYKLPDYLDCIWIKGLEVKLQSTSIYC